MNDMMIMKSISKDAIIIIIVIRESASALAHVLFCLATLGPCRWAMVTATTVGFGDLVPVTAGGKLVGAATAVTGVLLLALPATVWSQSAFSSIPTAPSDGLPSRI